MGVVANVHRCVQHLVKAPKAPKPNLTLSLLLVYGYMSMLHTDGYIN